MRELLEMRRQFVIQNVEFDVTDTRSVEKVNHAMATFHVVIRVEAPITPDKYRNTHVRIPKEDLSVECNAQP